MKVSASFRLSMRCTALIAPVLVALLAGTEARAQDLYLQGGYLVDPQAETVRRANLWIEDGRIAGYPELPPADFDGPVLNVSGRYIIPGLRDLHVHSAVQQAPGGVIDPLGSEETARRMMRAGVVGFLDLFHREDLILDLRDRQRRGSGAGQMAGQAEIFAAGPCLTATDGHCTEYPIPTRILDSPEDARRELGELVAKKPDVIKLVYEHIDAELVGKSWRKPRPTLDRETLRTAIELARQAGIPTVVHIRSWQDVVDVVELGASAVTHLPSYGSVPQGLAARMVEKGTVVIPTLASADTALVTDPELLSGEAMRPLASDRILAAYRAFDADLPRHQPMLGGIATARAARHAALATLAQAGVKIVAGTDSGNPWTIHGLSLHRELEFYVEAGLSPWHALAAASVEAGNFLGRRWGLQEGDEGTVVVLDASPIEDIRNTRRVGTVIRNGVVQFETPSSATQARTPRL